MEPEQALFTLLAIVNQKLAIKSRSGTIGFRKQVLIKTTDTTSVLIRTDSSKELEGYYLNRVLQAGLASTLSFLFHGFMWTKAFKLVIGNVFAEAFVFGGATITIVGLLVVVSKTTSLTNTYLTPALFQRQPLPSEARASALENTKDKLVSGSKSKENAKPSSTKTRFTSFPLE